MNIFLLVNFIAVLVLFISYLSVYISPDKFWIPAFFGLAFPFIVVGNILFVMFWLLIKPRYLFLSLFSILIGWGFVSRYVQLSGTKTEATNLKVVSYNVKHFFGDGDKRQRENAADIISFLDQLDADIICLQETRLRRNRIFNLQETVKELKSIQHYQYARSSNSFGMVTMTRFPIVNMEEIRFDESRNMSIFTDVVINNDTVRIFNVHLQSYQIHPSQYSIIESLGEDQEKDIKEMRKMGGKFKRAFQMRAKQVKEIRKYMDESPYEIIVCGDFNDTPVSYSYQEMKGELTDAFVNSGKGFGRTYIGKLPSFRIDYIFHSNIYESYNFKTYDSRLSDHFPISSELMRK